MRPLALGALLVLGGCPTPKKPPPMCEDTFIGDPTQPPEAVLVVTDGSSATLMDVHDGDEVPLVRPPQGGQVTYAAARVRNIHRCSVQFSGRFRDPATGAELGFDGRNADLIVDGDGWGHPDPLHLSALDNIPLCPDYDPVRDNQGAATTLEVTVSDQHGLSVKATASVVPTCTAAEPAIRALCVCECSHLPATGRMCGATDGGI